MGQWIPAAAQPKLNVFQNFTSGLARRPEVYGVSAADAAEAVRLVAQMEAAIIAADAPSTRTRLTVAAKRESLSATTKVLRRLASFIQLNPNLSEADLAALGLPVKAENRVVPPPTTTPLLSIRGIIPGGHQIEISDSATPARRVMPRGFKGLELFVAYSPHHGGGGGGNGEGLGIDSIIKSGQPYGILTRALARVIHPNDRVGSVANYIGRWINTRSEAGAFSQPVRMVLALPGESRLSEAA